ncbi:hypothetical protein [Tautonia rosea]|uniref:hypothetical protein n=1 Tax=Tautonia rosea TaxID=2728037 RepID=UPI001472C9BC|nr:hypothetical protein [Tautonia rosea]
MEWLSMMFGGGRGFVDSALLIGLFWAALVHPDRIRSLYSFRVATILLAVSVVVPLLTQLAWLQGTIRGGGAPGQGTGLTMVAQAVHPLVLMLAVLIGLDSVTPRSRSRG